MAEARHAADTSSHVQRSRPDPHDLPRQPARQLRRRRPLPPGAGPGHLPHPALRRLRAGRVPSPHDLPHCGADRLSWFEPDGAGVVYSTTVVRRKPEAGGDYNVALVDLKEGVRLMSRVEGVPPEAVRIGMSVRARIASENGQGLLVFAPQQEAT